MADTEWTTEDVRARFIEGHFVEGRARAAQQFDEWRTAHDAEVAAKALEDAAEFIVRPTEPGLDSYTLSQVYVEVRARAGALRGGQA